MGGLAGLVLSLTSSYAHAQTDPEKPRPLPILKVERGDVDKQSPGDEYILTTNVGNDQKEETIILNAELTRILTVTGYDPKIPIRTKTTETVISKAGTKITRNKIDVDRLFILTKDEGLYSLQYNADAGTGTNGFNVSLAKLDRPVAWIGDGKTIWVYSPAKETFEASTHSPGVVQKYTPEKKAIVAINTPVHNALTDPAKKQEDETRKRYKKEYEDRPQPFKTFPLSVMYGDFDPNVPGEEVRFSSDVNADGKPERILFNADLTKILAVEGWNPTYNSLATTLTTYEPNTVRPIRTVPGRGITCLYQGNTFYAFHLHPDTNQEHSYRAVLSTLAKDGEKQVIGTGQRLYTLHEDKTALSDDRLAPLSLDARIKSEIEAAYYTPSFYGFLHAQPRFQYNSVPVPVDPAVCTTFYEPTTNADKQSFLVYQNRMKAELAQAAQTCSLSSGTFTYYEPLGTKQRTIKYITSTTNNPCFRDAAQNIFTQHPYVVPEAAPGTCVPLTVTFIPSKK